MSDNYQRIELITGTARRRRWTTEQKLRIIEASYEPGESVLGYAAWGGAEPSLSMAALDGGGRRGRRWDRMLEAVEQRFGGSSYTAKETLDFAAALGLVPCFTSVHSRSRTASLKPLSKPSSATTLACITCRMLLRCSGRSP